MGDRRGEARPCGSRRGRAKARPLRGGDRTIDAAKALYGELDDDLGMGIVTHLSGTIAAQQGRYEEARERYLESVAIRERHDDRDQLGRLMSNLAIVAEYSSDFVESRRLNEEALAIRTSIGDRWAIALSLNNLAVIDLYERQFQEASDRYEESVRLAREVGDPWLLSLAYFNLGKARKGLGDDARARVIFGESIGVPATRRSVRPRRGDRGHRSNCRRKPAGRRARAARRRRPDAHRHRRRKTRCARVQLVADLAEAREALGAAADATMRWGARGPNETISASRSRSARCHDAPCVVKLRDSERLTE